MPEAQKNNMSLQQELEERSGNQCELCTSTANLTIYEVPPVGSAGFDGSVLICETCKTQIETPGAVNPNHWRCLNESMWSEVTAVQIVAWRMLTRLRSEGWPNDLLDMLYLDENNDKEYSAAASLNEFRKLYDEDSDLKPISQATNSGMKKSYSKHKLL